MTVPEVGLVVARWAAAKAGAVTAMWPTAPRWVGRYLQEMLSAHSHALVRNRPLPRKTAAPAEEVLTISR